MQSLLVVATSVLLILALYLFFGRTLYGKALRATAINRAGARLVGVSPNFAGMLTFTLAALLCAFCGILSQALWLGCIAGLLSALLATTRHLHRSELVRSGNLWYRRRMNGELVVMHTIPRSLRLWTSYLTE